MVGIGGSTERHRERYKTQSTESKMATSIQNMSSPTTAELKSRRALLADRKSSFVDDPRVVEKCRDPHFFFLEPGAGVILLGFLLEPDKWKHSLLWITALAGGCALTSQKGKLAKVLALLAVARALKPFGSGKYIRFLFGMATLMRAFRIIEILMNPAYFEERGIMFTTKFCFLYHDLRRASCFDLKRDEKEAEKEAVVDVASSVAGLASVLAALRLFPNIGRSRFALSVLSMFRFYFFISAVEAGYRLQLIKFGIRPPVCFDEPWKSETIAEFWGQRWNLSIAQQLRSIFFKPFAEAGYRKLGEFAVFVASSGVHMVPIVWLGGSKNAISSTALYFLLQPLLIAFEKQFKLKGRLWVQASMWSVAHLFAIPLYEVM